MRTCLNQKRLLVSLVLLIGSLLMVVSVPASAERIKELASVQGVRSNQLLGYGIIVGLDGTGDSTSQAPFTSQSVQSMLAQLGVQLPSGVTPQLKNTAAVMITANLPPYARPGQAIDVTVSSLGNAKSLRGGTLLLSPLRGADNQVYAVAQGNVIVSGAGASAGGASVQVNHLSAGRVPNGATVERAVPNEVLSEDVIYLELKRTDFSTVRAVVDTINEQIQTFDGLPPAEAVDARVIRVQMPPEPSQRVAFMAEVENLDVASVRPIARVIVNARTGSVVMNQAVELAVSAVAHGNLSVTISSDPLVSQPAPLSKGETVVAEKANITIEQEGGGLILMDGAARLSDVVKALNALGATSQDLIAILQALKAAGSLKADLEII
ncbi:MAG: flagellar basal body P-ring protein FlgI [Burkholderiaceae bacterium]